VNLQELEKRLQALEEIEAIKRLKARYCAMCDAGYDSNGLAGLFTEDAVWDGGSFGHEAPLLLQVVPMLCQQCDRAPCEPVCAVFASAHTKEGLNQQIYNRCVGSRYCNNNCPNNVRRFNWSLPEWDKPLNLQLNPDVSVRGAGYLVLEEINAGPNVTYLRDIYQTKGKA
jgi:Fe-S-cluster-containing dehydrogenase component